MNAHTTRWRCLIAVSLWLAVPGMTPAGDVPIRHACGTRAQTGTAHSPGETGGIYLPSEGVLRALIVFASFPDDETPHPYWPPHQPPLFMDAFIDPDTSVRSSGSFNITHYFRQMSLGKFHLIGDAIWVESGQSQEKYRLSGSYGHANMDILPDRVDSVVDFSRYDNWTRRADYDHLNVPDGVVDMIVMVWRTTMFEYLGEASLGYKPALEVDGKRIEMGYPAYIPLPVGSGVTCEYPYGDTPAQVMRTMVHEVSHWLLGIFHPYNGTKPDGKFQFWGMLCNGQRVSSCANAYDRERLGWITPVTLTPGSTIALDDFVTTGAAAKFHPPAGDPFEYYYLENHQQRSPLDDVTLNPADRGIWVLHQQGPYSEMDNLRIRVSDGFWEWNAGGTTAYAGGTVPVFSRGLPRVADGLSHRDQLRSPTSILNWLTAFRQQDGPVICGSLFAGEGFRGAFDTSAVRVFSPAGNPGSFAWSGSASALWFEVTGEQDGVLTLTMPVDPVALSPARRFLGQDPARVPAPAGSVRLAWGDQWTHGQPLESDLAESELERSVGDGGAWVRVYAGPATTWNDESLPYDTAATIPVRFRARVRDVQGQVSSWSNEHVVRIAASTAVDPRPGVNPGPAGAVDGPSLANYPNPFNSSTTIHFNVPVGGPVLVEVLDLLGRRIRGLVRDHCAPGVHSVVWDGYDEHQRAVSAGVYLCRLEGSGVAASRMMILLR